MIDDSGSAIAARGVVYPTLLAAFVVLITGCTERPDFTPGGSCEVNSECEAPLVCRLDFCRTECRENRDCSAELACVQDELGFGACQLPSEKDCLFAQDCPSGLVCRFGECTNDCNADVDCPVGSTCVTENTPEAEQGCVDRTERDCILNSDCNLILSCSADADCPGDEICGAGATCVDRRLVCAVDNRCREQCREERDCRDGRVCLDEPDGLRVCVMPPDPHRIAPFPARLVGGSFHTCVAFADQRMRCWGDNPDGQLADGSTSTDISIAGVEVIGAGPHQTCAQTAAGLMCWGRNADGQLGNGTTSMTATPTPQTVNDPLTMMPLRVAAITGGTTHTCAIDAMGAAWCWGGNAAGQLGDGGTSPSTVPVRVQGLRGTPIQIAARGDHTCALFADGRVQCWGANDFGQLGNGTSGAAPTSTPQDVMGLTDAVEVVAGSNHSCARRVAGQVVCWGDNIDGQLGNGTTSAPMMPTPVPSTPVPLSGAAVELAAGLSHTCAVVGEAETVQCWGRNAELQCGKEFALPGDGQLTAPHTVTSLAGVDELSTGESHSCARIGDRVHCWGQNSAGQLDGNLGGMQAFMPIEVSFP